MKMTIREIAEVAGCDYQHAKREARKMFGMGTRGKPRRLDSDESMDLMKVLKKTNMVSLEGQNDLLKGQNDQPSTLTSKDVELISSIVSMTVAKTIEALDGRMAKIETRIEDRQALLPPSKSPRKQLGQLVNQYAQKHDIPHNIAWNQLYTECYYTLGKNYKVRAKNEGVKAIDLIETTGEIENVLGVMIGLLEA